jgi:hypothetical protein
VGPGGTPGPPSPGAGIIAADEGRHVGSPAEQWTFTAGRAGLDLLLVVQLTLVPSEERASFAAAVRLDPAYAVVLVAADLPLPRLGLELRGPGIWADHNIEEPLKRWSLGLEAFGVGIAVTPDVDLEVLLATSGSPDLRGDRAPLGWDLEWTSVAPPEAGGEASGGYRIDCRVEGEILTSDGGWELDEAGERAHRW